MKRMWLGALALLGLIGCGGGTTHRSGAVETDWVGNVTDSVPAGYSACVEGPYTIPSGAYIVFDITDTLGDAMDVSVVPDGAACDGRTGYASVGSDNWGGSVSKETATLPGGNYNLAVTCSNLIENCDFSVDTFGYVY